MNDDRYGGLGYRHLFAWSARLQREWPFLERVLGAAPERSVIDLGCGPGEHLGRLASEGWSGLGIDTSPAQIEAARAHHPRVDFVQGSMDRLDELTDRRFGAALCLGNVLPNLDDAVLARTLDALARRLLPGGVLVLHLLEYTRILRGERRAIGPVFRPPRDGVAEGDETIFLRVFAPGPDPRHVHFVAMTMDLHAEGDPAVEVGEVQRIVHRAWTEAELRRALTSAHFTGVTAHGDLLGSAHDPQRSDDLVLVARRAEED